MLSESVIIFEDVKKSHGFSVPVFPRFQFFYALALMALFAYPQISLAAIPLNEFNNIKQSLHSLSENAGSECKMPELPARFVSEAHYLEFGPEIIAYEKCLSTIRNVVGNASILPQIIAQWQRADAAQQQEMAKIFEADGLSANERLRVQMTRFDMALKERMRQFVKEMEDSESSRPLDNNLMNRLGSCSDDWQELHRRQEAMRETRNAYNDLVEELRSQQLALSSYLLNPSVYNQKVNETNMFGRQVEKRRVLLEESENELSQLRNDFNQSCGSLAVPEAERIATCNYEQNHEFCKAKGWMSD